LKGVDEDDAVERDVATVVQLVEGGLDVHRSDVVREEHDLVGVQLAGVLPQQVLGLDQPGLEQPHDERPRASERVDDLHTGRGQRRVEVPFQGLVGGAEDEVHDRDRCVDDPERVGGLGQRGLEELLVQLGDEPSRWRNGGDSFDKAAAALGGYAGTLRWAQGQAAEAIRQWDAAQAATAQAKADHLAAVDHVNQQNKYNAVYGDRTQLPAPQFSDTGEVGRQAAREIVNRARQQLTEAADRASQTIWAEGDGAPETGFWEDVGGFFADVGQGIADPFVSGGKLLLSMTGISAFWDDNFDQPMVTTAQNAKFLATHPVEFAKALTDWNTWSDSPGRAIGHLLGGVAMTGVAGKVVGELAHIPGKAEVRSPLGAGVKTIDAKPLSIEQKQVEKKYNSHANGLRRQRPAR
jgi:hypothetical protein